MASRVSIFDVKKCSGGGQLRLSRRQWFLMLFDELDECSSEREVERREAVKSSMVSGLWWQLHRTSIACSDVFCNRFLAFDHTNPTYANYGDVAIHRQG